MKKIANTLLQFIREDFDLKPYLVTLFFSIFALYLNYFSDLKGNNFSLEEKYSQQFRADNLLYLWYLPFYGLPYFLILIVKLNSESQFFQFSKKQFWLKISFILLLLCLDGGFNFNAQWLKPLPFNEKHTLFEFINAGHSFFTVFIPISVFYFLFDRKNFPFNYGLLARKSNVKPYFILLLFICPIIFAASFSEDFLMNYPSYNQIFLKGIYSFSEKSIKIFYEICYLLDFINLELLMRGLMVVGMSQILGRHAILPTTMVYMLLHFEKPFAEALGSIFGGYLLSILAYKTKSIQGGIILHMGLAFLMELFAYFQIFSK